MIGKVTTTLLAAVALLMGSGVALAALVRRKR